MRFVGLQEGHQACIYTNRTTTPTNSLLRDLASINSRKIGQLNKISKPVAAAEVVGLVVIPKLMCLATLSKFTLYHAETVKKSVITHNNGITITHKKC